MCGYQIIFTYNQWEDANSKDLLFPAEVFNMSSTEIGGARRKK